MPISTKFDRLSKRDHITKGAELRDEENTNYNFNVTNAYILLKNVLMLHHLNYTSLGKDNII
jgi:hypothetical protein